MEMANESDDENVELISRKQVAQRLDVQQRANSVGLKTQTVSAPLVENSSLSRRAAIGLLLVLASVLLVTIFSQLHEASSPASHSSKPVIDSSSNSHSVATNADYLKTSGDIILKSLTQIKDYWRIRDYPLFLSTMDIPAESWEIQKNKFILQIIRQQQSLSRGKFVVAFTGSSVTAGHDNFVSDMYSEVFQQVSAPAFSALNITLEASEVVCGALISF